MALLVVDPKKWWIYLLTTLIGCAKSAHQGARFEFALPSHEAQP
jgi:hypothetical protein